MRLNTRVRREDYTAALAELDRAELRGDREAADAIYNGALKAATARLPVRVRARLDDELPCGCSECLPARAGELLA